MISNQRNSSSGNCYEKLKNGSYDTPSSMPIKDKIKCYNQSINSQKEDNSRSSRNRNHEMQNFEVIKHDNDQPLSMKDKISIYSKNIETNERSQKMKPPQHSNLYKSECKNLDKNDEKYSKGMTRSAIYENQRNYAVQPNIIKQRAATFNQSIQKHSVFRNDTLKNEIDNINVNDKKDKQDDQYENDDSDDCMYLTQNDEDENNKSAMIKQLDRFYGKIAQDQYSNPPKLKPFDKNKSKPNEMRSQKDIVQDYLNEIDIPAIEQKINKITIDKNSIPKEYLQEIQEQIKDIPKDKKITYKKQSYSYTIHDIITDGMNDNITYIGSFLKVKINGNQVTPINNLKRKPLKLSLKLESSSNYNLKVETVKDICLSNVRIAINNLVKDFSQKKKYKFH